MKKYSTTDTGRKSEYLAPEVTTFEIRVEAGFATSSGSNEGMGEGEEQDPWS